MLNRILGGEVRDKNGKCRRKRKNGIAERDTRKTNFGREIGRRAKAQKG